MKEKIIVTETHAEHRILARGLKFGLNFPETEARVKLAVYAGKESAFKHKSRDHKTYYHYFEDNLSIYVICKEIEFTEYVQTLIKTIIIERGRE